MTMMKKYMSQKIVLFALLFTGLFPGMNAQGQTPQQVMESIYQAYDSVPYLSYDVKYIYDSDTLYGEFTHEVMEGSFTMAGKKAKYRLGNIDFIQNDSFFLAIYHADKYILVSDPRTTNAGSELPMRQLIDSLVTTYALHYTLTTSILDSTTGKINFAKNDSLAAFLNFAITYDTTRHLLKSIEYSFEEPPVMEPGVEYVSLPATRRKTLKIEFLKYRVDNFSPELYEENSYIFFEDGVCKPVEKYIDYRIFYSRAGSRQ